MVKRIWLPLVLIVGIPCLAFSAPQPRALSGTINSGSLIRIFGEGFGERSTEASRAPFQEDLDNLTSCILVGDAPSLARCSVREIMIPEMWSPQVINFYLVEENLTEGTEYYFFVIDAEGQTSSPIGPWMIGMGILERTGRLIPLVPGNVSLRLEGSVPGPPGNASVGPGRPGKPELGR